MGVSFLMISFFLVVSACELYSDTGDFVKCGKYDQEIEIKSGTRKILNASFVSCNKLWRLTIPASVEYIDKDAFFDFNPKNPFEAAYYLTNLLIIQIDPENKNYTTIDNVIYTKDLSTLVFCPPKREKNEINIPKNTTKIGNGAFFGTGIENFEGYDSIKEIGKGAFMGCAMNSFSINDGCEIIGDFAFFRSNINEIYIPSSIKEIGKFIFSHNPVIYFEKNETQSIQNYAFYNGLLTDYENRTIIYGTKELRYIYIPQTVECIREGAFVSMSERIIVLVSKNNHLATIKDFAFYNTKMAEAFIPKGLKEIGSYALFSPENEFKRIFIPRSVTKLGNAFITSKQIREIKVEQGNQNFYVKDNFTLLSKKNDRIIITAQWKSPSSLDLSKTKIAIIDDYSFNSNWCLRTIKIPKTISYIGIGAFKDCTMLSEVIIDKKAKVDTIHPYTFAFCELPYFSVPDSVEFIHDNSFISVTRIPICLNFSRNARIKKIGNITAKIHEIPRTVEEIFPSVRLLKHTKSIHPENKYFIMENRTIFNYNKTELIFVIEIYEKVYTIPETVSIIKFHSLTNTMFCESIKIPSNIKIVEDTAFSFMRSIHLIFENPQFTYWGSQPELSINNKEITIPESLTTLNSFILGECNQLRKVRLSKSLVFIDILPFYEASIEEILLEENVRYLLSYSLPLTIRKLNISKNNPYFSTDRNNSFLCNKDGTELIYFPVKEKRTQLFIPEGIKVIKFRAFFGCSLEKITFPYSLEVIEPEAFYNTGLTSVHLTNYSESFITRLINETAELEHEYDGDKSSIKEIGRYAFLANKIPYIVIPQRVNKLGSLFVEGNTIIYFTDAHPDFIFKGPYITDSTKTILKKVFLKTKTLKIEEGIKTISECACLNKNIEKIEFPQSLIEIEAYGVAFNIKLAKIIMPHDSQLKVIGQSAFRSCRLETFEFPASIETIENNAFESCIFLREADLSKTKIERLSQSVFERCESLVELKLPNSIFIIGFSACSKCYSLEHVHIDSCKDVSICTDSFSYTKIRRGKITNTCPNDVIPRYNKVITPRPTQIITPSPTPTKKVKKGKKKAKKANIIALVFAVALICIAIFIPTTKLMGGDHPSEEESLLPK